VFRPSVGVCTHKDYRLNLIFVLALLLNVTLKCSLSAASAYLYLVCLYFRIFYWVFESYPFFRLTFMLYMLLYICRIYDVYILIF